MREGSASRTAVWVSVLRGLADLERPSIVADPVARSLVPRPYQVLLAIAHRAPRATGALLGALATVSGDRSRHMSLRTRAIDDVVAKEAGEGSAQVVLLGAGLDGRAYRMTSLGRSVVFEVDHPDTQAYKQPRSASLPRAARDVRFVPLDFARQSLGTELARAGFDAGMRSVFVWEGVTMYLEAAAIERTVASVSASMSPGSVLAATYYDLQEQPEGRLVGVLVGMVGEPFKTRMSAGEIADVLETHQLVVESDESDLDWSSRYLGHEGGTSLERLVVARKMVR